MIYNNNKQNLKNIYQSSHISSIISHNIFVYTPETEFLIIHEQA